MEEYGIVKNRIYHGGRFKYRKVIAFYDGLNGERRVQYENGFVDSNNEWQTLSEKTFNCSNLSFMKWFVNHLHRND